MPAYQIHYTKTEATGGTYTEKSPFVADFNGDGLDDVFAFGLVFPPQGPGVAPARLYIQQTDGTFVASRPLADGTDLLTTMVAFGVGYIGDLNGDGIADVFGGAMGWDSAPDWPPEQSRLLLGTKDGKFIDATSQLPQRLNNTHSYAAGDIDRDGDIDFFIGNVDASGPYVMLNDGKGNFTVSPNRLPASFGPSYRVSESEFFDFNKDGFLDLAVGALHGQGKVFWGSASGAFSDNKATLLPLPAYSSNPITLNINAFDFNNDGHLDLLYGGVKEYAQTGGIQLLLNSGNGQFIDATNGFFTGATTVVEDVYQILMLDLNNDGATDIVRQNITHPMGASEAIFWLNDGGNRFTAVTAGELGLAGTIFANWYRGPDGHYRILGAAGDYLEGGFVNFLTPTDELRAVFADAGPRGDHFTAVAGSQIYNGGKGLDWISYSVARGSVTARAVSASEVSVSDAAGEDRLLSVERLSFSDGTLAFDFSGVAGQAYRLYQAAFDRTPDTSGLGHWIRELDRGAGDLAWMANNFINSDEFKAKYGTPATVGNEAFLTLIYQNVLDRAPDAGGMSYWMGELGRGLARERMLASFSESPENQANVAGAIHDGIWYL